MDKILHKFSSVLGENRIKKEVDLKSLTTFKIGGPAEYYFEANSLAELTKSIKLARDLSISYHIIGGGSNLLISDDGISGLVIKNKTNSIKIIGIKGKINKSASNINEVYLDVDSGVYINRLVRFCLDEGLIGLENFLGQPGSVGGALYMNAHNMKKNDYFGNHIYQASILSNDGNKITLSQTDFQFGYDKSILQKTGELVLSVNFKFKKGDKTNLWKEAHQALEYRNQTQPQGVASAGCIFRNISYSDAMRLATPNFSKSAGFLIDRVGLKGKRIGNAQISPIHANFIYNLGGARASDVLKLITLAKNKVKAKFGLLLEEEVVLLGF